MATFIRIASVTVGAGGASSIDFTSIPSTYTDLCVLISSRVAAASISGGGVITLNSTTVSTSTRNLFGNGSTASSNSSSSAGAAGYLGEIASGASTTASTFGSALIYIPNYLSTTSKSYSSDWVTENNATSVYTGFTAGIMGLTSAINSISIAANGTTFVQYSSATLYGIKSS